jgi:PhnB protein
MATKLNPYINLRGTARQAVTFYQTVFGGKVTISTFGESGVPADQAPANDVMHSQLEADNGITLMVSDAPMHMRLAEASNISISLSSNDEAELRGYWEKLSQGGTITVPLEKAPWGDTFGMLKDQFGVDWMVNITAKKS